MAAKNMTLEGYWADSPYEFSLNYPSANAPMPSGSGFNKIAAMVALVKGMGLRVAKTFNSMAGGQTSDKAFYTGTIKDCEATLAVVPSPASGGHGFDAVMVETWYFFPATAIPETTAYTTAYTALSVFDKISEPA